MDCSICSPVLSLILRPPRNSICQACYEGAKGMIDFLNKLEHNRKIIDGPSCSYLPKSSSSKFQGISDALKWVKDMNERLGFLSGSLTAFKDGIHADIRVKPGIGSSIFAHRVVLAARSGIFKNMLETNGCKAPPNETISLPELNHEELESLLEFLYNGSLPIDKLDKNIYSLLIAAGKYEIPFLQKICENRMLESIDSSNALNVLKVSKLCSNTKLNEAAINFMNKHMENSGLPSGYDASLEDINNKFQKFRIDNRGHRDRREDRGRSKSKDRGRSKSKDRGRSRDNNIRRSKSKVRDNNIRRGKSKVRGRSKSKDRGRRSSSHNNIKGRNKSKDRGKSSHGYRK